MIGIHRIHLLLFFDSPFAISLNFVFNLPSINTFFFFWFYFSTWPFSTNRGTLSDTYNPILSFS